MTSFRDPVSTLIVVLALAGCGSTVSPNDGGGGLDAVSDVAADRGTMGRVPMFHRASADACSTTRPAGNCAFTGSGPPNTCHTDSDCAMGTNGRCSNSAGPPGCYCNYDDCHTDSDCMPSQLCACRGVVGVAESAPNRCTASECRTDADCGAGGYCSPSRSGGCGGVNGFYCHTAGDQCLDDSDCADAGFGPSGVCGYQSTNHRWECAPNLLCP